MGQPRDFPEFPQPKPAPTKKFAPESPLRPTPQLPQFDATRYGIEIIEYFQKIDQINDDLAKRLIIQYSGGKVKREGLDEFTDTEKFGKVLKEFFGFFGAQLFKRIALDHSGSAADKYLTPGVESPVDKARREARERYIASGQILSEQRIALLELLVGTLVTAGALSSTPAELLPQLVAGGPLGPSPRTTTILDGARLIAEGGQLAGAPGAAPPSNALVAAALQLAKGIVRELVTERADP